MIQLARCPHCGRMSAFRFEEDDDMQVSVENAAAAYETNCRHCGKKVGLVFSVTFDFEFDRVEKGEA